MLLLKSLVAWGLILCLAVANGALREAILIPSLGRSSGLVLSGVLLCLCVAAVACAFVRIKPDTTVTQSILVGALWLCLTLVFEFSFGRYFQHKSWSELLAAYTFKDGNLWLIVLLVTLIAPYVATLVQAKSKHANNGA